MTFLEHLEELRWTLVRSAIAIVVGMVGCFIAKDLLFDEVILAPKNASFITYRAMCALGHRIGMGDAMCVGDLVFTLQNITMSGQFFTHLMVSFVGGFILAFPFVLWQIWRFIAPGLHDSEKGSVAGLVFSASALFLIGVAFGYFLLTPLSIQFFGTYQVSSSVQNTVALDSYIAMVTSVTLWTGLTFELPLIILFLTRAGLVTPAFLRTYRKHAFVGILIIAAVLTPPDVVSQLIVSAPLMLLYEFGIFIAARTVKRMQRGAVAKALQSSTSGR
ncbi:MAG: twin-arginine translocase subunit TatC [Flavobacteriales bacterium]|jgi:sec-independent protein translocase protein TatC|nr:twin-arginine translocase subunit TatC [Flavobacteriales bacterium]